MSKKNNPIELASFKDIDNRLRLMKNFYTLNRLPSNCPWKRFEGYSKKRFIKENFSLIQRHTDFFKETFSNLCKEIAFVKVFIKKLQRDYWFTLYYMGKDEDKELVYFFGGEPEYNVSMNKKFKKIGWESYPNELLEFWKIHSVLGIWYGEINSLEFLESSLFDNSEIIIPHYYSLTKFFWEQLGWNIKESISSIDEKNNFFMNRYILDGICLSIFSNSDSLILIRPYIKKKFLEEFYNEREPFEDFNELYAHVKELQDEQSYTKRLTQYYFFAHDSGSYFYDFYEYLIREMNICLR